MSDRFSNTLGERRGRHGSLSTAQAAARERAELHDAIARGDLDEPLRAVRRARGTDADRLVEAIAARVATLVPDHDPPPAAPLNGCERALAAALGLPAFERGDVVWRTATGDVAHVLSARSDGVHAGLCGRPLDVDGYEPGTWADWNAAACLSCETHLRLAGRLAQADMYGALPGPAAASDVRDAVSRTAAALIPQATSPQAVLDGARASYDDMLPAALAALAPPRLPPGLLPDPDAGRWAPEPRSYRLDAQDWEAALRGACAQRRKRGGSLDELLAAVGERALAAAHRQELQRLHAQRGVAYAAWEYGGASTERPAVAISSDWSQLAARASALVRDELRLYRHSGRKTRKLVAEVSRGHDDGKVWWGAASGGIAQPDGTVLPVGHLGGGRAPRAPRERVIAAQAGEDYGVLMTQGWVHATSEHPAAWHNEMRKLARARRASVRLHTSGTHVSAFLPEHELWFLAQQTLAGAHDVPDAPVLWQTVHDDGSGVTVTRATCGRCGTTVSATVTDGVPVLDEGGPCAG